MPLYYPPLPFNATDIIIQTLDNNLPLSNMSVFFYCKHLILNVVAYFTVITGIIVCPPLILQNIQSCLSANNGKVTMMQFCLTKFSINRVQTHCHFEIVLKEVHLQLKFTDGFSGYLKPCLTWRSHIIWSKLRSAQRHRLIRPKSVQTDSLHRCVSIHPTADHITVAHTLCAWCVRPAFNPTKPL